MILRRRKTMPTSDYKEWLLEQLTDLDFAAGYITEAIAEGESAFLLAVRDVVEAQGGISNLSKTTSLNREGLYDMLSDKGNPRLSSLSSIFNALGLQISVTKKIEGTEAA
jgi:probable addiction module antidote protein